MKHILIVVLLATFLTLEVTAGCRRRNCGSSSCGSCTSCSSCTTSACQSSCCSSGCSVQPDDEIDYDDDRSQVIPINGGSTVVSPSVNNTNNLNFTAELTINNEINNENVIHTPITVNSSLVNNIEIRTNGSRGQSYPIFIPIPGQGQSRPVYIPYPVYQPVPQPQPQPQLVPVYQPQQPVYQPIPQPQPLPVYQPQTQVIYTQRQPQPQYIPVSPCQAAAAAQSSQSGQVIPGSQGCPFSQANTQQIYTQPFYDYGQYVYNQPSPCTTGACPYQEAQSNQQANQQADGGIQLLTRFNRQKKEVVLKTK